MNEFVLVDEFYCETLLRAVEEVRFERRWKLWVSVKGSKCVVRIRRFIFPVTVLFVDGTRVRILTHEGRVVWEAYQRRASAQEPLRRLIDELRFQNLLSQWCGAEPLQGDVGDMSV
ncbi:MAG: hypothetical protein RMK18_03060 [Armatimonadota bacterium]|nr:hypothetical protein [Armatimonadota bacterium]MCX7776995.1 hypothetical protein [Armatimonadota bacterium]MDW8024829.1 hypothetical protein [Armatimonadota bacterium]